MLKRIQHPRPKVSREAYTLQSISRAWPDGTWVEELAPEVEGGPSQPDLQSVSSAPPSITIIGGETYDTAALNLFLFDEVAPDALVIVGAGRGVEADVYENSDDEVVLRIEADADLFGKKAMSVNVEQTISYDLTSTLVIVGNGTRAKQAKSWVKRAKWPREVVLFP
jgi:hypothetical protein